MKSISIIIPTKNAGKHLASTLGCLEKEKNIEIIVVDSSSTDQTIEIVENIGCICISEPDTGQVQAINKGIKRSTGDIIGFLNADDLLFPNALTRVRDCFLNHPFMKVLYGQGIHIDEDGNWLEDYPTRPWDYSLLKTECFLCQPAVFWRREIHDEFGYFDEDLHYALDYDFWLRLGRQLPFHYLEYEYLAKSRLHSLAKTIRFPLQAKWENMLVKQRHNQWIDTKSALEYCSLHVKENLEERNNPPQFAREMHGIMCKIEAEFTIQDHHSWETSRKHMEEMGTASTNPKSNPAKKLTILVDISLFQAGGVHGGIKQAVYSLIQEIQNIGRCSLVLVISDKIKSEIQETFGSNIKTVICDEDTQIENLKVSVNPDLLFCPLPSLRFHHPELPLIFLTPDLLHLDYPASLTDADIEYRHRLLLEARDKADLFLTVSKFSRDRLLKAYEIPHRKVWVLPHALPRNRTRSMVNGNRNATPHFLYPANFWPHKNHKTLLIGYKNYLQHAKRPWKLLLTGHPDSGNSNQIVGLIEDLGLEPFVEFKGFLENQDYDEVWANTGALVFPSNYEGFGLPLLEAMEWKVPIISADLPSLREVAESAAYFIDQHSPEAISNALLKISEDAALRETLVEKGTNRSQSFNWKQPAETFSNLASNLLEFKKSRSS